MADTAGVVLVTGCSTGLGVSIALQAARAGYRVYATMRNLGKRKTLDAAAEKAGVSLKVLALDVEQTDSVNAAMDAVIAEEGRIDAVICNAGVGFVRTIEQATEDDIEWVMNVNFKGVVRCVKAALPHMRQARSGRIIAVSSVGGLVGQPFNEIYCASKFAVEGYIESLASYVGPAFGLHFTVVEPGGISSEFASSALKHFSETGGMVEDEYLPLIQKYIGGRDVRDDEGVFQTPDAVAEVVIKCLTVEEPPVRTRTSDWSERFSKLKTESDPDGKALQAQVFDSMIGLD